MIISKLDLLPYVPFSVERAAQDAQLVQPEILVYPLCATSGEGMAAWLEFLIASRRHTFAGADRQRSCPS
jgi:hydrogenase nickel incorporation protein HypB